MRAATTLHARTRWHTRQDDPGTVAGREAVALRQASESFEAKMEALHP